MKIFYKTYKEIIDDSIPFPPECGGIIGGRNDIICSVFWDINTSMNSVFYTPNVKVLNECIKQWNIKKIELYGIFHTHACNWRTLSTEDKRYIKSIMTCVSDYTDRLYFPIVFPRKEIISFMAEKTESGIDIINDKVEIIYGEEKNYEE